MKRNQTIDLLRGVCMLYIVGVFHLTQYLGESFYLNNNVYGNSLMWSCLGTFSLISGYLLGSKYECKSIRDALFFYKKRIIRLYPLFVLSAICLFFIGFNDLSQTISSLLGLAPFVTHHPKTLWYISMILIFYLLSPIVLTSKNKKILFSIVILLFFCILSRVIPVDLRFLYNLMLYLLGICAASFKLERLNIAPYLKWIGCIGLFSVYFIMIFNLTGKAGLPYLLATNFVGVFVLVLLASLLMRNVSSESKVISFLSYVSLSSYLFHRLTYWICLEIYNPEVILYRALYLVLIALPVGLIFAYYIQKLYDSIVQRAIIKS